MERKTYRFEPKFKVVGQMPIYSESVIKNEPMLFSADMHFAYNKGGSIIRRFIDSALSKTPKDDWIIDVKVAMLMKGWYPCIPGWHHDDIPRSTPNGQPNYDNPEYKAEHIFCVIGDCSMTEFFKGIITLPKVENNTVYGVWNHLINKNIIEADIFKCKNGELYYFTDSDFHRGVPATKSGWRVFIRASRSTNRIFHNEIRNQVQIYLPAHEAGW
jgi:hypothetical protein